MRLAAFVVTFDRPAILRDTISRLLLQTRRPEVVVVVDNGGNPETARVVESFGSDAEYHPKGFNSGPAGAGATGLELLVGRGFDWIYCGDDDDPPLTSDTIERLLAVATTAEQPVGAVGALGTPWDWRTGTRVRRLQLPESGPVDIHIIGGGRQLIVAREAVEAVGLPNAELFFGYEDFEYCLRIRRAGFHIVADAALFRRYLGLVPARWTQRWYDRKRPRDALWRQYYNSRNYIWLMRHEFGRERLALLEVLRALGRIARGWRWGVGYGFAFTGLQLRAILDGYLGRLGMTVPPVPKHPHEEASRRAGPELPEASRP